MNISIKHWFKMIGLGAATWSVPFVIAIFLHSPDTEQLLISRGLFNSLMVLSGSVAGASFFVIYFMNLRNDFLRLGVIIGIVWLLVHVILDFVILVWSFGMGGYEWFISIGIIYPSIPVMSIAIGYLMQRARGA